MSRVLSFRGGRVSFSGAFEKKFLSTGSGTARLLHRGCIFKVFDGTFWYFCLMVEVSLADLECSLVSHAWNGEIAVRRMLHRLLLIW